MIKQNLRFIPLLAIAGILTIIAFGCGKEDDDMNDKKPAEVATLTTASVSEVTSTSAKSGGNITNDGGAAITARGVVWGTSENPTITSNSGITSDGTGTGTFTSNLSGLDPGTAYYVRAYATNSEGTAYGNQVPFSAGAQPPTVTTAEIVDKTTNLAIGGGEVTDDGASQVTARGVVWSTSDNPTLDDNDGFTTDDAGTGEFTSELTGLDPATAYYVRAYATNSAGTAYGNQVQFSTDALPPTVITAEIADSTENSAIGGGEVTDDGGAGVTARGVVWSTSENPTLDDNDGFTTDDAGTGEFTSELTGLDRETTYYVRAYATNSGGTGYGEQVQFTTLYGTVTDADDNVYLVVRIGDQEWMAENLRTTKYNDGTAITNITGDSQWRDNRTTGAYCWYDNDESNGEIYGAIYNWLAVETGKLCPTGWRVASDEDWTELTEFLGGLDVAGGKLKEVGTEHWNDPNEGATDEYGFRALPGGNRDILNGSFTLKGIIGFWYTSTADGANIWYRAMSNGSTGVTRARAASDYGFYVRCIKE